MGGLGPRDERGRPEGPSASPGVLLLEAPPLVSGTRLPPKGPAFPRRSRKPASPPPPSYLRHKWLASLGNQRERMSGVSKADVQAAAKDLKFQTSVVKDANGKPSVQVTARAPVGFLRGSAPVHPWTKGGLSFWVPEAVRMRHFVLGEYFHTYSTSCPPSDPDGGPPLGLGDIFSLTTSAPSVPPPGHLLD